MLPCDLPVYGPRQMPTLEGGVVAIFLDRMRGEQDTEIFGDGNQTRDFVYVGDVVAALVAAAASRAGGTYNLGSGSQSRSASCIAYAPRSPAWRRSRGSRPRHRAPLRGPARRNPSANSVRDSRQDEGECRHSDECHDELYQAAQENGSQGPGERVLRGRRRRRT